MAHFAAAKDLMDKCLKMGMITRDLHKVIGSRPNLDMVSVLIFFCFGDLQLDADLMNLLDMESMNEGNNSGHLNFFSSLDLTSLTGSPM